MTPGSLPTSPTSSPPNLTSPDVSRAEIAELVARMPAVGTTLVNLHRRLTAADSEVDNYRAQVSGDPSRPASTPDAVRRGP